MSLGLLLNGRYESEKNQSPQEASARFLHRIEEWANQHLLDTLIRVFYGTWVGGQPILFLQLHPAGEPLEILGIGRGRLVVSSIASLCGPGYHQYVCDVLHSMSRDLEISWDPFDPMEGTRDETKYFIEGERAGVERVALDLLQMITQQALRMLDLSTDQVMLALPADHLYQYEGVIATASGPRDEYWLEQTAQNPKEGIDIFPWWDEGQGASYLLGRALCQMWTDLRWRFPLNETETNALEEVADLLASAYQMDPTLLYPWREWSEILSYLQKKDDLASLVTQNALEISVEERLIGYRRNPVRVFLQETWSIEIPGAFAETFEETGSLYACDALRSLRFTPLKTTDTEPEVWRNQLPEGKETFQWSSDPTGVTQTSIKGEAVLRQLTEEENTFWELLAKNTFDNDQVVCQFRFQEEHEKEWALQTWYSLQYIPKSQQ